MLRRLWRRLDNFLSVEINPQPKELAAFLSERDLKAWNVFSDAAFGGRSKALMRWEGQDEPKHLVFEGRYDKTLGEDSELVRSGYAGFNTILPRTLDLSLHDHLTFRVRAHTAHAYMASLRTEQYSAANGEEAWQAPVVPIRVGEWEEVVLPLQSLRFTFRGRMSTQGGGRTLTRPERCKVIGLGLTLSATEDMPMQEDFRLDVASISAVSMALSEAAAAAKAQHMDLSPEQEEAYERERRTLQAAKRLKAPGAGRRSIEQ